MTRPLRWLWHALAALSLLLCLATAAAWVRSYWVADEIYHDRWTVRGTTADESARWLFACRGRIGTGLRVQSIRFASETQMREQLDSGAGRSEFKWKRTPAAGEPSFV